MDAQKRKVSLPVSVSTEDRYIYINDRIGSYVDNLALASTSTAIGTLP